MSFSKQIKEARLRRASGETQSAAPEELLYPEGVTQADVLFLVGSPPAPGWWETRGRLSTDLLLESGITSACVTLPSEGRLRALIEELSPKVICNRALLIDPETTGRLAADYPHIKFLAMNQSSMGYLIWTARQWEQHWGEFWNLAESRENCYIVSPDERNHLGLLRPDLAGKLLWVPNPSRIPEFTPRAIGDPPLVSLIAAGRPFKNFPAQLLGYALAFRAREMRLLVSVRNDYGQRLQPMCDRLRIEAEFSPWQEWAEYMDRLRTVDVCLQVSYTESFNYVALEHMLVGAPVVGSDAIRYLPAHWETGCDSPEGIARRILSRLDNWPSDSALARKIAVEFAEMRNQEFQDCFRRLLE